MLLARPLGTVFQLRRFLYRAEPALVKLALPDEVPEPARSWLVRARDAVAALGFEPLETIRVDRGSYTFTCLMENAETRTIAVLSWHARSRTVLFETMTGTRRRLTISSDSTIDLPLPDDVDAVELFGIVPSELLNVHRTLVSSSHDADPSSYRSTPTAARNDPIGFIRDREIRSRDALVRAGVAVLSGEEMRFTWSGAIRVVFSTTIPLSVVRAFLRARRTNKLVSAHGAEGPIEKRGSTARSVLYFAIVLIIMLVVWNALVPR